MAQNVHNRRIGTCIQTTTLSRAERRVGRRSLTIVHNFTTYVYVPDLLLLRGLRGELDVDPSKSALSCYSATSGPWLLSPLGHYDC